MRRVLFLILVLAIAGCDEPRDCPDCSYFAVDHVPSYATTAPAVDLPELMRQENWGGGSCVHASTVNLLRWQGQDEMAEWWRKNYSGGEYADRLHRRLDSAKLRYAYTVDGDIRFLEWALRTRRGAGITFWPAHAVNLVHLDERRAGLLDNNRTEKIIYIQRDEFVRRWRGYGGWAWTVVYTPAPPPLILPDLPERK